MARRALKRPQTVLVRTVRRNFAAGIMLPEPSVNFVKFGKYSDTPAALP